MANNKRNQKGRSDKTQNKQTSEDAKHKTSSSANKKNNFH